MHTTAAKWNEANHKINVFYFLQNPRMLNSIHASWERHLVSKNFDGTLYLDTKKNYNLWYWNLQQIVKYLMINWKHLWLLYLPNSYRKASKESV